MGAPLRSMVTSKHTWTSSGKFCACGECRCSVREALGDGEGIPQDVGVVEAKGVVVSFDPDTGKVDYLNWLDDDDDPYINVVYFVAPTDSELEMYLAEEDEGYNNECFDTLIDDLSESMEAADNDIYDDPAALMQCDTCGADILHDEPVILMSHGRLVESKREPVGGSGNRVVFAEDERLHEQVICLNCARNANDLRTPPIWQGQLYNIRVVYA